MKSQWSRSLVLVCCGAVGVLSSGVAHADDPQAEALYQEGRRAMDAKDLALACKKFKESQEREPAPGTLLNLAGCEEKTAKLADALAHFQAAARTFRPGDPRVAYAKERAAALENTIPKLRVHVPPSAAGATVECDGTAIDRARLAGGIPLDPGDHVVVLRVSGQPDLRRTVRLAPGESRDVEFVLGAVPALSESQGSLPSGVSSPATNSATKPGSTLRTVGFVTLGVGAVGLGVGLLGGLLTMDAKSNADSECAPRCTQNGLDAQTQGKTWSTVSTAGFVAAGVGLLAGGGILLFGPSPKNRVGALRAYPLAGGTELRWSQEF